jgi:hypothetical protein
MNLDNKNIDDLAREKLSGGSYPFKESYWAGAEKVIAANTIKKGLFFSSIYLKMTAVALASFLVAWYVFTPSISTGSINAQSDPESLSQNIPELTNAQNIINKSRLNQNNSELSNRALAQENSTKTSTTLTDKKLAVATIKTISANFKSPSLPVIVSRLSSNSSIQKTRESFIEKDPFLENNLLSSRSNVSSLVMKQLNFDRLSQTLLTTELAKSKVKKSTYSEIALSLFGQINLNKEISEFGIGEKIEYHRGINNKFLISVGLENLSLKQTREIESFEVSIIETLEINSFQAFEYSEKTKLVPGVIFIDGVAFNGMVEESYLDSMLTTKLDTTLLQSLDSVSSKNNESLSARYISIPISFYYLHSISKFDFRLGAGLTIGQRIGDEPKVRNEIKENSLYPDLRLSANANASLGYFLSELWSAELSVGYHHILNSSTKGIGNLRSSVGIRYSF